MKKKKMAMAMAMILRPPSMCALFAFRQQWRPHSRAPGRLFPWIPAPVIALHPPLWLSSPPQIYTSELFWRAILVWSIYIYEGMMCNVRRNNSKLKFLEGIFFSLISALDGLMELFGDVPFFFNIRRGWCDGTFRWCPGDHVGPHTFENDVCPRNGECLVLIRHAR